MYLNPSIIMMILQLTPQTYFSKKEKENLVD